MPNNSAPLSSVMARTPDYYKQKSQAEKAIGKKLSNAEFERDYLCGGGVVGKKLLSGEAAWHPGFYTKKKKKEQELGRKLTNKEFEENYLTPGGQSTLDNTGTSIFDPVLCEIDYAWFTAEGDSILDPFAGGSVRGVVAEAMGRQYTGIELRQEQVDANYEQAEELCQNSPKWICGDAMDVDDHVGDAYFDHILTCPPYGNLEVYSDLDNDLSAMDDNSFDEAYTEILARACKHLKQDRFATIVVGNYRDRRGLLRDLCGITVRAMEDAGCRFYNDFILVTPAGSLPIRIGKQFSASRKMGRLHQYVLNFVKGDPKKATERLGEVAMPDVGDAIE